MIIIQLIESSYFSVVFFHFISACLIEKKNNLKEILINFCLQFTMRSPSPTRDQARLASNLELRMREHDYETEALTHHQRVNRDIMSKKMAEMSKLQNTLTNQAKVC